jgi:hypothetical protein
MITHDVHQKVVDLLGCAVKNLECDIPSIRSVVAPRIEIEAAVVRSLEFSLNLMLKAVELSAEDESMQVAIAQRAAHLEAVIAEAQANILQWTAEEEANRSTKH